MDKILQYINQNTNYKSIEKEDLSDYIDEQVDRCLKKALVRSLNIESNATYATMYLFWKDIKKEVEKEL